jgi:hypothetical protein
VLLNPNAIALELKVYREQYRKQLLAIFFLVLLRKTPELTSKLKINLQLSAFAVQSFSFTKLAQIRTFFHIFVVTNYNKLVMSLFSDNIRALRVKHKISQEK